jgi:PrgI family protein
MATYKVIQDIEAEDKFLGPLTLKQFVFGAVGIFFGYLNVFALTRGFPYALIIFTPPMALGIFLAVPWSKDQPTEVWVLAKLRFYFKPRRRIWDQSGMEELVTITAPKKEEKQLTDNLSKTEVKSRLQILAETIDSRGWAIKNAQINNVVTPTLASDRLVSATTLPQEVPIIDLASIPDVYDETTAPTENFDRMIQQSTDIRKAQNLEKMNRIRNGEPLESIKLPEVHFTPPPTDYQRFADAKPIDEKALTQELKTRKAPDALATAHMRKIKPLSSATNTTSAIDDSTDDTDDENNAKTDHQKTQAETMPKVSTPAILDLAGNNDLDVATIARQAKKEASKDSDEVVISLH